MLMEGRKILLTPENVGRKTMEAKRRAKSGGERSIFVILAVLVPAGPCIKKRAIRKFEEVRNGV